MAMKAIEMHKGVEGGGPSGPVSPIKLGEREGRGEGNGYACSSHCMFEMLSGSEELSEPVPDLGNVWSPANELL
jgi:hypothetical protein